MAIIDADAHVLETERTWDYMLEAERSMRPRIVATPGDAASGGESWLLDGTTLGKGRNVGARAFERRGRAVDKSAVLRKNKIWVACQTDDDLPYVLKYSGDDMLVIGTDYGHNDTSSEILALRKLKEDGAVPPPVVRKILADKPRALYGL